MDLSKILRFFKRPIPKLLYQFDKHMSISIDPNTLDIDTIWEGSTITHCCLNVPDVIVVSLKEAYKLGCLNAIRKVDESIKQLKASKPDVISDHDDDMYALGQYLASFPEKIENIVSNLSVSAEGQLLE